MTVAACALPDIDDDSADPIRELADLAACAMRMVRRAVEQYEALTAPAAQPPEPAAAPDLPDPGTLFTRAARVVLDCITKEYRLLAGLPLAPARPRATPHADSSTRTGFSADSVRQARRTVTSNHPNGEEIPCQGMAQSESAEAAPDQPPNQLIDTPHFVSRVCAAAGIPLNRALRRRLARDPIVRSLADKPPAPD